MRFLNIINFTLLTALPILSTRFGNTASLNGFETEVIEALNKNNNFIFELITKDFLCDYKLRSQYGGDQFSKSPVFFSKRDDG